jgi:hypothetical protein
LSLARAFLRAFFVLAALAIFIVVFIQPTGSIPPGYSVLAVLVIELLAWVLARIAIPTGFLRTLIRVFILSLFTAAFIVYVLQPATRLSFDSAFLIVFAIEVMGFLAAGVLTIRGKAALASRKS